MIEIRAGWRRFASATIDVAAGCVVLEGVEFRPGRIVTPQLASATAAALVVVTLGPEFDVWSRGFFERGDPYLGYLADTIGSEMAEAAAEATQGALEADLLEAGLRTTRRFSPGYCRWDVAEQTALFSLLPDRFCGITLGASSFMSPVKSVSALIGVGPDATKAPYPCRRCDAEDCPHREVVS